MNENLLSGQGQENVKLKLENVHSGEKIYVVKREYDNSNFGPSFQVEKNKLKKWIDAYKQWKIHPKPKASYAYPPYFVPYFAFQKEFINMEFTISNIEEYVIEFSTSNKLRDWTEDDTFEMVMKVYEPCSSGPHNTTTHEKWDKLREMIRKMTQS